MNGESGTETYRPPCAKQRASGNWPEASGSLTCPLRQPRGVGWGGREAGRGLKREGTHVYLWLIHADAWQKAAQHCKATILQLKKKKRISREKKKDGKLNLKISDST